MQIAANLKLSHRLGLGYGIVLSLLVAMAVLALLSQSQATDRTRRIVEVEGARSEAVIAMTRHVTDSALAMRNLAVVSDPARLGAEYKTLKQALERYDAGVKALQAQLVDAGAVAENAQLAKVHQAAELTRSILGIAAEKAGSTDPEDLGLAVRTELSVDLPKWNKAQADWIEAMHELRQLLVAAGRRSFEDMQRASTQAGTALVGIALAALAIGAFAAVRITRSVTAPVRVAVQAAHRIADGDLAAPIHSGSRDELGLLLAALEHMRTQLHELAGKVQASTQEIGTASSEVASGSRDLSTRTEQTAANLQRTAASMAHVQDMVEKNLRATQQADAVMADTMSAALRGGEVVRGAVSHMQGLAKVSQRIGEIVGVIDGIAAQTNILAINAAVEAAHAGEQGRGFAVVAGDVRVLAQRCAQAAREVKELIGMSSAQVDEGSRMVLEAGATMQGIVDRIQSVKQLIGDINGAANLQSRGIGEVNADVSRLDNMTQQNAALVEQSAAAACSLQDQAERLVDAVSVFRLAGPAAHSGH